MGTAHVARLDAATASAPGLHLVRAAAVLRWTRPDLTATLAELALDAAADAEEWITAAGWLLHGRGALGDGRETASGLLDGLVRWGEPALELMSEPVGRRLRVELAGPARQIGEPVAARALLSADRNVDETDPELRADVLTELARCAVDDEPDTADAALHAAEQAWEAAGCAAGVASVMLLRATRHRQAGRADLAIAQALDGLSRMNAGGRRAGATESDHVAAALTAEWIAALVDADRVDEARSAALPAADRLLSVARTSRQIAGLRLAIARVTAVAAGPDVVITAVEPAAQDAADSDVPELESACRSMLGELYEAAGRLDAALAAVRTALAADRSDRDRGARLRTRLAAAGSWAVGPGTGTVAHRNAVAAAWSGDGAGSADAREPADTAAGAVMLDGRDGGADGEAFFRSSDARPDPIAAADDQHEPGRGGGRLAEPDGTSRIGVGSGRRARRLAAEAMGAPAVPTDLDERAPAASSRDHRSAGRTGGAHGRARNGSALPHAHHDGGAPGDGGFGDVRPVLPVRGGTGPRERRRSAEETSATWQLAPQADDANSAHAGAAVGSGSLIGDELLRELAEGGRPGDRLPARTTRGVPASGVRRDNARDGVVAEHDPLFGDRAFGGREERDGTGRWHGTDEQNAVGPGAGLDPHTVRWNGASTWEDRPSSVDDTVVLDSAVYDAGPAQPTDAASAHRRGMDGSSDLPHRGRHAPAGDAGRPGVHVGHGDIDRPRHAGPGEPRHAGPGDTVQYDPSSDDGAWYAGTAQAGPVPGRAPDGERAAGPADVPSAQGGSGRAGGPAPDGGRRGGSPDPGHPWGTSGAIGGGARESADRGAADGHAAHANGSPDTLEGDGAGQGSTADRGRAGPGGAGVSRTGRRPARRQAAGEPGQPPSTDPDGLGLADLLAGALAAYRNM